MAKGNLDNKNGLGDEDDIETQERVLKVNLVNHEVEAQEPVSSYHVDCNFQNVEEPSYQTNGGVHSVRVDDF